MVMTTMKMARVVSACSVRICKAQSWLIILLNNTFGLLIVRCVAGICRLYNKQHCLQSVPRYSLNVIFAIMWYKLTAVRKAYIFTYFIIIISLFTHMLLYSLRYVRAQHGQCSSHAVTVLYMHRGRKTRTENIFFRTSNDFFSWLPFFFDLYPCSHRDLGTKRSKSFLGDDAWKKKVTPDQTKTTSSSGACHWEKNTKILAAFTPIITRLPD